jgi:hypothetical protein
MSRPCCYFCMGVCVLWCVFRQVNERVLLHTIAFQLSVPLPFPHVYRLAILVLGKNAERQAQLIVKSAWTFVADRSFVFSSFSSCFCLGPSLTLSRLGLSLFLFLSLVLVSWSLGLLSWCLVWVLVLRLGLGLGLGLLSWSLVLGLRSSVLFWSWLLSLVVYFSLRICR